MLLTAFSALLLIYISAGTGVYFLHALQKIFKQQLHANTLGVILAGLVFCTVYFNIISFWLPVNYLSLIPLFILSSYVFGRQTMGASIFILSVKTQVALLFSPRNLFVAITVCAMLAYYWLMPPVNADSPGYHYSTIRWFETYKVIHGLANVDGRLAYNSAAFIIQAAFAFTGITGQPLYPLNGVLTVLFFLWMLGRIVQSGSLKSVAWLVLLYLLNRVLLVNMSSPTADTLVVICLAYAIIKLFDAVIENKATGYYLLPCILLLYAVIAKLSAYPALLLIPLVLWKVKQQQNVFSVIRVIIFIGAVIYIPWLCRNVVLSGYLLYPVPFIDIFNVDWKAPKDVLLLDYLYIKRLPINFEDSLVALKPPPFPYWVWPWVQRQISNGMLSQLFILMAAICSPLYWLIMRVAKIRFYKRALHTWAIIYICIILWLVNVPEYRFGIIFISFAIVMPFIAVRETGIKQPAAIRLIISLVFIAQSAWYIYTAPGWKNVHAFSATHFLVYPLKDNHYYINNNQADFYYTQLGNGVKLYHQDSTHDCINAALPCMIYKYGTIQMRGNKIDDGFKNIQDDVSKNYPFVK